MDSGSMLVDFARGMLNPGGVLVLTGCAVGTNENYVQGLANTIGFSVRAYNNDFWIRSPLVSKNWIECSPQKSNP